MARALAWAWAAAPHAAGEASLPLSVEAAVQRRLDHLPVDDKDVAKRVGISIGTVMSRLFYARRKMAALMASYKREELK